MICTECGQVFVAESTLEDICPKCQCEDVPEAHMVFRNCNVCGIALRTKHEHEVGMCERCERE